MMTRMTRRPGAVLLEVIAALTILSTAAVATVAVTSDALALVQRAWTLDAETRAASAFMDAVALWPRADLDRRLGEREQGTWLLYIERTSSNLYSVVLRDASTGSGLLSTALYRPE